MLPLGINRRMDIAVQRDLHIRMPQYFAQAFNIHAASDAVCGKRMPQRVEILVRDSGLCKIGF